MGKWTVNALVHLNLEVEVEAESDEAARAKAQEILEDRYPTAALIDVVDWWEKG